MPADDLAYRLRSLEPGDLGWVIHRHGVLYYAEFGWGLPFETLVAEIAAGILRNFDANAECGWIAERDGQKLGVVFLVRGSETVAKLRLLLVEPSARGMGVGTGLVSAAIEFAREKGYGRIMLWTHRELATAQRIYRKLGFSLMEEKEHAEWGVPVVGQTWELDLKT